jgi:hypothetical protein
MQLALVRALAKTAGEAETLLVKQFYRLHRGSGSIEGFKDQAHRRLNFGIRIENKNAVVPVDKTDRRPHLQFAAPSFVEHPASHPCFEEMKFCFRHGPFQTEQKPVVKVCRVVNAILIENERAGQRTQLNQPVPIGGVPGQARYFQSHHQTRLAEGNFADELLKPIPASRS